MRIWNQLIGLRTAVLVAVFSIVDLVAVCLHQLHIRGVLESRFFRLARDRGFAELIQYGKFGLMILMLVRWNRNRRSGLLVAWIILFSVMLVDDALGLHEEIGGGLMHIITFPEIDGIRTKDIAEAAVFAILEGAACLYVLGRFFTAPADLRRVSWLLAIALLPLVLFGLVLDVLPWHWLEQPGEMVAMSILLATMHRAFCHREPSTMTP